MNGAAAGHHRALTSAKVGNYGVVIRTESHDEVRGWVLALDQHVVQIRWPRGEITTVTIEHIESVTAIPPTSRSRPPQVVPREAIEEPEGVPPMTAVDGEAAAGADDDTGGLF